MRVWSPAKPLSVPALGVCRCEQLPLGAAPGAVGAGRWRVSRAVGHSAPLREARSSPTCAGEPRGDRHTCVHESPGPSGVRESASSCLPGHPQRADSIVLGAPCWVPLQEGRPEGPPPQQPRPNQQNCLPLQVWEPGAQATGGWAAHPAASAGLQELMLPGCLLSEGASVGLMTPSYSYLC